MPSWTVRRAATRPLGPSSGSAAWVYNGGDADPNTKRRTTGREQRPQLASCFPLLYGSPISLSPSPAAHVANTGRSMLRRALPDVKRSAHRFQLWKAGQGHIHAVRRLPCALCCVATHSALCGGSRAYTCRLHISDGTEYKPFGTLQRQVCRSQGRACRPRGTAA